ncbi:MAG: glycosyltransferase family 4 protein [Mesorhizobium sp.]|uniref:glycosyltransferase n=1 Tax=Mesorhizobium sp. TaxID=1871066 RepID=UPI000FE5E795|nr:glycosyltransferase [Mesorhizobium sp.]RWH84719.1 MAG: glycosyltransferase family 4 protein [Mesorhizobium sp.]RWH87108.1 MAG: glycosyltransferase family 4 protein [Mesorhizobium sp.]RWH93353.1 MAG: glycosyltransferase family 4 protein [Mesorhizobium sp.]RWI03188.1 MAG: glycosyltransferase family 4 protein [Mesorhizobium sp.]RWI05697.1 MAG: glycosyltransferase family 4 protein [Mesorhizobium sp.]
MNIVMFTNTFTPHVGGVAHSVASLSEMLREMGHAVLIVAPDYAEAARSESDILRVPAIQNFNGSDFSVPIPFTRSLEKTLNAFEPDIVHSHHPFLLGDTALRIAASRALPTIFTYHTRYELYGHYVAQDAPVLQRLVLSLAAGYCDLCEHIIAPTRSIADLLHHHDVTKPITIIPTGIDLARFAEGDRLRLRSRLGLAETDFIVGHVGRLAPEKNLTYLTEAVCLFLSQNELAHFVAAGDGASASEMRRMLDEAGLQDRCHLLGVVEGAELADVYAAMDVFAFSSRSETQGLVLVEAMATGVPVVGLDEPGVREVVRNGKNGYLLSADASPGQFSKALARVRAITASGRAALQEEARQTAASYARSSTARQTVELYSQAVASHAGARATRTRSFEATLEGLKQEWRILANLANAVKDAVATRGDSAK